MYLKVYQFFFILNLYIEASYNQDNYKNSNLNLYNQVKNSTNNLDPNFYIKEINILKVL